MAEPFDVTTDEQGGTTLVPNFATSGPQPPDIGLLPDLTQALGPRPSLPMPQPLPPPPSPTQDPRQQLLAIAALSMAAGMGPQAGGAGAFHGFMQGQQVLQADQSAKYRMQLAQQAQQQQIALQQAQSDQRLFDQRAQTVERAIINFKTASEKVGSKQEYDALADAYGAALQQYGVRNMDGNWLRANVPYMKPSEAKTAEKAFANWMKNPTNAQLLKDNPQGAANSVVEVDLNADGVKERIPFRQLADKAGQGFAQGPDGQILAAPRGIAGTSAFDMLLNARYKKFTAENGKEPDPKQYEQMVQKAIIDSKDKPPSVTVNANGQPGEGLTNDGLDYAATQLRVTGTMPPLGMGKTPDRARIINRAAEQAKLLGQSPVAAIQKQAAYKSDATALTKMRTMSSAAESYENKALTQADIVADLSAKVNRTQWPLVNQAIISGNTTLLGDSNTQQFVNAITTFSAEYAKIMEGSTGSSAGSSDAARKAADRLISARMNKGTLRDTLELMKREMRATIQGYDATIAHISERMGSAPPAAPAAPAVPNSGRFTIIQKGGAD